MNQARTIGVLLIFLFVFTCFAYADDTPEKKWKDEAEFLYVQTNGNTEVLTLAFKNMLAYQFSEHFKGAWNVTALDSKTDGDQTAERYYTDLRLDYLFTEHWYTYASGSWLKDKFAGFDNRYSFGPGAGYKILVGPKNFLLAELGLNYAHEDYVDSDAESFAEGRAFGKYEFAFTEKNRFSLTFEYLQDFSETDNYKVNSEAAVISALTDILSLKVSYVVRYQNRPLPKELEQTDTVFGAAIVVTY